MTRLYAPSRLRPTKPVNKPALGSSSSNSLPSQRWRDYSRYSACLLVAILAYLALYWLLSHFYPNQVQHWLWPNSFLPVLTLLFVGNFFLLTFIFLDKKIGLLLAIIINWLAYLRLQQFVWDWTVLVSTLLLAGLVTSLTWTNKS